MQTYVFSAFNGPSNDAEGQELGLSELAGRSFSYKVNQWIDATLDPQEGWILVTPADGNFRKNDSGDRIEVRMQDGLVVLVQHLMP